MSKSIFKCKCCAMTTVVENNDQYKVVDDKDGIIRSLVADKIGAKLTKSSSFTVAMGAALVAANLMDDNEEISMTDYLGRLALVGVTTYLATSLFTSGKWNRITHRFMKTDVVTGYCNNCYDNYVTPSNIIDIN